MYYNINKSDVVNEILKTEEKISELIEKEEVDKKQLLKLRTQQLMLGLALNTGNIKNRKLY